jgi:diguanylate cyclase (GGDEF)-like protein
MPSEAHLSHVLREFAHTLVTDFSIQAVLDHLVQGIVEILPVTGAGVTVMSPGADPRFVAASDELAMRFVELQTELGEGPCVTTYETGDPIALANLHRESRFPEFVRRAREAGLAAVFTFPLRNGAKQLGALDLYRTSPGRLGIEATEAAQTLADVAAAYLLNAQARVDRRESLDRSRELALHDGLTGLPNRILLLERLDHAVLRGRRSGKMAAILFVDLDRFKLINDVHGHGVGDELLVAVAQRLRAIVRPGDTLARMSGDEFVILCEHLEATTSASSGLQVDEIAARIVAAVASPFALATGDVQVTASVGIAFAGPGAQISEELLHDADTAMSQAKRRGGARHQIIDLREQHLTDERANLENDLRGASTRGELRTEYQPIVDTTTGRIAGVEALLRWAHPSRGEVTPAVLVPIAERSGLITEIGRWVLEQTCADRQSWNQRHQADGLSMSVNVSAHQLMSPNYARTVAAVLAETNTDPGLVTLEVTESVFVQDSERALVVLNDLKALGVKLALDDFGTGYSSLNYLKRFPIDIVKIDQSFVADIENDRASHAIVFAVVELAHMLGMTVVAEGVETAEQHRRLASLGCDSCQGYYFARPISADALDTLITPQVDGKSARLPAFATVS